MREKDTWLFAAIAHGFTAVSCVGSCIYHLLRDDPNESDFLRVLRILNAALWPITFAVSLRNYRRAVAEEAEQDCIPF